jgi:cytochrome c
MLVASKSRIQLSDSVAVSVTAALFLQLISTPAPAADNLSALLIEKRCNACHEMNSVLIGPPYVAIATRHTAEKDSMIEVLARKIVLGGGGNWGVVPMVPNEHVTLDEARAMAKWILEVE